MIRLALLRIRVANGWAGYSRISTRELKSFGATYHAAMRPDQGVGGSKYIFLMKCLKYIRFGAIFVDFKEVPTKNFALASVYRKCGRKCGRKFPLQSK